MKTEQRTSLFQNPAVSWSFAVILLAGCSPDESPAPMPMESVLALEAELAADPKRLEEMQRRCKYEREIVGEQVCTAVSGAARKRFMRSGQSKYTPQPVDIPNPPYADSP